MKQKLLFFLSILVAGAGLVFLLFLYTYPVRGLFEQTVMLNTKIKDRNGILLYETLHSDQGKTTAIALENLLRRPNSNLNSGENQPLTFSIK